MIDHLEHILKHVGEDGVGFGSDFDGAKNPGRNRRCRGVQNLVKVMRTRGYGEPLIEKLCYKNWLRVLGQTWGTRDPTETDYSVKLHFAESSARLSSVSGSADATSRSRSSPRRRKPRKLDLKATARDGSLAAARMDATRKFSPLAFCSLALTSCNLLRSKARSAAFSP